MISLLSVWEWSGSSCIRASGSPKTVAASSKVTLCFFAFWRAFSLRIAFIGVQNNRSLRTFSESLIREQLLREDRINTTSPTVPQLLKLISN